VNGHGHVGRPIYRPTTQPAIVGHVLVMLRFLFPKDILVL
jgi:hypothetical protein